MAFTDEEPQSEIWPLLAWLFPIPFLGFVLTWSGGVDGEYGNILVVSVGGLICGLIVLISIFAGSSYAGRDRHRLARFFDPSIRLIMIALAVSIICQAALFVFGLFALEASLIGRVHGGILLAISLGAFLASLNLVTSSFRILKSSPMALRAVVIEPVEEARLWDLVRSLAGRLSSIVPDNVIVGLEPNFFVTANPVSLVGQDRILSGNTLYLSASLMRLYSEGELTAVIGHELGHFRGSDVEYSMKFAPAYFRLEQALHGLAVGENGGAADLAKLPALVALSSGLSKFAQAERAIGRDREFEADRAGVEAASARDLATALLKVSAFGALWNSLTEMNISELREDRLYTNLSQTFVSMCEHVAESTDWENERAWLFANQQPHPIDTHPPLAARVEALGVPLETLHVSANMIPPESSVRILNTPEVHEEALSMLEAHWLTAIGAVTALEPTEG